MVQLISHAGVFDIDDIILNVLGMITIYFVMTNMNEFLKKNKKSIIIFLITFIINSWLFQGLSWYEFGDIPTLMVLMRFIFFFVIIYIIINCFYRLFKRRK